MPGRFQKCLRASQQRHKCVKHDVVMTLGRFYCRYLRNARDLMRNCYPILFKFCAFVNYMLVYTMAITNLAALFLDFLTPPRIYGARLLMIGFVSQVARWRKCTIPSVADPWVSCLLDLVKPGNCGFYTEQKKKLNNRPPKIFE